MCKAFRNGQEEDKSTANGMSLRNILIQGICFAGRLPSAAYREPSLQPTICCSVNSSIYGETLEAAVTQWRKSIRDTHSKYNSRRPLPLH